MATEAITISVVSAEALAISVEDSTEDLTLAADTEAIALAVAAPEAISLEAC
jgi:hypothetical protein